MDTFKICNYFGMQYQYLGTFKTPLDSLKVELH